MIKKILFGTPLTWNPEGRGTKYWANCFNGTFSNGRPISIMINNGVVIQDNACHYLWGFDETVLYIKKDGSHGSARVMTYTQIEGYKDIVFAIGGVGLSDYKPELEGFCVFDEVNSWTKQEEHKDFSDVLDDTYHSVFGFKDDKMFSAIMSGTGEEVALECKKHGLTDCVMGDGRSWSSCNTDDYQLHLDKPQYSLVQMTKLIRYELPVVDKPVETVDKPVTSTSIFKLSDLANPHTPILPVLHFYFDEYLQNNLTLKGYEGYDFNVIEDPNVMYEIVFHALMMEEYRSEIGRGISCTSGYRPDMYNDVILIKKGYKSTKTSDHKCIKSCALDTNVPVTTSNIDKWKAKCKKYGVSYSIGLYSWGLHLGYRRNQSVRLWDWR